ncbi:MAG: hypothetical protein H8D45_19565 [Bacteroidetes bacterium]|nr:hypothetical protein [Bacteroidota bacterium]MBL7103613.1 hypothetical protein [Bacteroidales bacterium]
MRFNRRHILLIILALALLVLFLPIKVHYDFEATALVYPTKEWYLKRGQDDSYISELHNFETNAISDLKSFKFERGDIAEIHLKKGLTSDDFVKSSDTIAYIHSYSIENELIRLKNLKEIEQAMLSMNIAGEKQELIDQATQKYEFAKQQLNLEQKNFNRQKKLFNDSIISEAEFDMYDNTYNLAKINVQIAYNELLSLQSGKKSEEIDYIYQKINSYTKEIKMLEHLQGQYYINTPIDGIVSFGTVLDGIITISDTSRYILKIPVKVHNIQYLDRITAIKFSIPGNDEKIGASFIGYDEKIGASFIGYDESVNLLANPQMVMAKAVINAGFCNIYPGMAVHCKVICDEITIFEFLKRGLRLRF